jgi:hypothetical protein
MSSIVNYYQMMPKKYQSKMKLYKNFEQMHILIPNRIALIGSSGSGKSNVLINFILGMNCFSKIYMFVKSPDEPLYKFLIEEMRSIEKTMDREIIFVYTDIAELEDFDSYASDENKLFVFDDVISEKTAKLQRVADLWIRGRKCGITTVFLSQSYYKIPQLIRQNTEILIFKKIGTKRDLNMILADSSLDVTLPQLQAMYKSCETSSITSFFMIDKSIGQEPEYMFRCGWTPLAIPSA